MWFYGFHTCIYMNIVDCVLHFDSIQVMYSIRRSLQLSLQHPYWSSHEVPVRFLVRAFLWRTGFETRLWYGQLQENKYFLGPWQWLFGPIMEHLIFPTMYIQTQKPKWFVWIVQALRVFPTNKADGLPPASSGSWNSSRFMLDCPEH